MAYPQPGPYPAYPQYPGQTGMPAKPPVPQTVQNAFYLMLAGAGLQLVSIIVGFATISKIRDQIESQHPDFDTTQVDNAVHVGLVFAAVIGLIEVGLWIWMAFANRAGKNWARITGTVFFGISCLGFIALVAASSGSGPFSTEKASPVGVIVGVLAWLVGLVTVILLWNKQSGQYFKPPQFGPGVGYPYPYAMPGQQPMPPQPGMQPQPGAQQPYGGVPEQQSGDPWANNPPQ